MKDIARKSIKTNIDQKKGYGILSLFIIGLLPFLLPTPLFASDHSTPTDKQTGSTIPLFQKENLYQPYIEIGMIKFFNQESSAAGLYDLFIPLFSPRHNQLLFADLRIFDRTGSSLEGNAHIGYRILPPDTKQFYGIYASFDRKRSLYKHYFNQMTLGGEIWQNNWFLGGNLYTPIGKKKRVISTELPTTTELRIKKESGRSIDRIVEYQEITTTKHTKHLTEQALFGLDAEVGYSFTKQITGYAGGYCFQDSFWRSSDKREAKTKWGPKIRLTYRYDPIGTKRILSILDGLNLETGIQHDKPRGTSGYLGIKLRAGLTRSKDTTNNIARFESHMTELVRRDPDIILDETNKTEKSTKFTLLHDTPIEREKTLPELLKEVGLPKEATHEQAEKQYTRIKKDHRKASLTAFQKDQTTGGEEQQNKLHSSFDKQTTLYKTILEKFNQEKNPNPLPLQNPSSDHSKYAVALFDQQRAFSPTRNDQSIVLSSSDSLNSTKAPFMQAFPAETINKKEQKKWALQSAENNIITPSALLYWREKPKTRIILSDFTRSTHSTTKKKIIYDQSQNNLLRKLTLYMKTMSPRSTDLMKRFQSQEGHCGGLTSLWLYSKWLSTQPNNEDGYNNTWFKNTVLSIAKWDGKRKEKTFSDFERFISLIDFFQASQDYLQKTQHNHENNMPFSLLDTKNKPLTRRFTIVSDFTESQFTNLLQHIVYEHELIRISLLSNNEHHPISHVVGLFKNGETYYLYDSEENNGEKTYNSVDKVAKYVFSSIKQRENDPLSLGIVVSSFNEKRNRYPNQKTILSTTNPRFTKHILATATDMNCLSTLEFFLKKRVNPNEKLQNGETMLGIASQNGYFNIVKKLVFKKANINQANNGGNTPLMAAAQAGHLDIVEFLLKRKANPHQANHEGITTLIIASQNGHAGIVEKLLEYKADPHQATNQGITPLMAASEYGHTDIIKILLGKQVDPNRKDSDGLTALRLASENGHYNAVEILLDNKAKPDQTDDEGRTPLMAATKNEHLHIAKKLLERKASIDKTGNDGNTALMIALITENVDVAEFLLNNNANPNRLNNDKLTPLMIASFKGNADAVDILLKHKANPNQADETGRTALLLASSKGDAGIVDILLKHKANPNLVTKKGTTALILASAYGHTEVVKKLLDAGATTHNKDDKGKTAWTYAAAKGHTHILEILSESGKQDL